MTANVALTTTAGTGGCLIQGVTTFKQTCQINGTRPAVSIIVR